MSPYLADIIILLIAAVLVVPISQTIKLGAVPGFLIAGILVGPYGLGLINNITEIAHLAEIGVVLLLFVIGIELKPSRLWQMRRLVFGLGTAQVAFTGLLISCVAYYQFEMSLRTAVLIGPTLALSSTAFVLQLLSEQKALTSTYGRTCLSVLLLQDIAVVPLLALVPLLAMSEWNIGKELGFALLESVSILAIVVIIGRRFMHPILHRVAISKNPEVFTASAVLLVLGTAIISEHIGLSMAMGAFLAGLLISDSSYRHQVLAEIQPFRGLLLGLFFMSMGMELNINLLIGNTAQTLILLLSLVTIKIIMLWPFAVWFGINPRKSLAVSFILAQSGEFALVLFSLAFQSNILTEQLFQQLLLIVLLSMLITPILASFAQRLIKNKKSPTPHNAEPPVEAPIVLAGFGRVGKRVGDILSIANKPYVALDADAHTVETERENGYPVFYGDVLKPELLNAAGAQNARVVIVTLNDQDATNQLVSSLRHSYPDMTIYARGQSLSHCIELKKLGATDVVSENIEASMELTHMLLTNIGIHKTRRDAILRNFRRSYHQQIEEGTHSKDR